MQLPLQQTAVRDLSLITTKWKAILDPVIANPMTNMSILKNVILVSGNNAIPHLLQQIQQGWIIVDIQGAATIYRSAAFNDTYLYLNSSTIATVNIGVF